MRVFVCFVFYALWVNVNQIMQKKKQTKLMNLNDLRFGYATGVKSRVWQIYNAKRSLV